MKWITAQMNMVYDPAFKLYQPKEVKEHAREREIALYFYQTNLRTYKKLCKLRMFGFLSCNNNFVKIKQVKQSTRVRFS